MSSELVYLNDNHKIVPKEEATWRVDHIYDEDGELIEEEWEDLTKKGLR